MSRMDRFRQAAIYCFETHAKRRNTFRYWRELEGTQWLPRSELAQLQVAALRGLLEHAAAYCPYYRGRWLELGLRPGDFTCLEDFRRWPVVTKDTIREHRPAMRSTCPSVKSFAKTTGGSSGVPLEFDVSTGSQERRMAASYRGYAWAGAAPGTKQFYLWGAPTADRPLWQQWKDWAYHRVLYRHYVLNTFHLSEDSVPKFLVALNRFRPHAIVAYCNPLYEFAKSLKRRGSRPFSPRSIVVGAEKLHDFQRRLIEEVFQAPVFETYGCREFMLMGADCDRHDGLHLTAETLLIEILDEAGQPAPPGREGRVVVTDFYNYATPFIRYENGDRAIAGCEQCSCGRGLPLLRQVTGRILDILTTPDGRRVPGEFFVYLLKDYTNIERFQVVQEQPDLISLKIVPTSRWTPGDELGVEREVRKVTGEVVRLIIERVDEIPLTRSGKLQVVLNRCAPGPHGLADQA